MQVIGPDDVPRIDFVALHELVDLNRAHRLRRDADSPDTQALSNGFKTIMDAWFRRGTHPTSI
jgi:hypothetical protein